MKLTVLPTSIEGVSREEMLHDALAEIQIACERYKQGSVRS